MMDPIPVAELTALLGRWAAGRGPLYALLAARLRALIEEGALAPDTVLPAERTLAAHLSVGRGTVVAAFELLRDEGRVVRRRGSGTRVARGDRASDAHHTAATLTDARVPDPNAPATAGSQFLSLFEPTAGTLALTCAAPDTPPPELTAAYREAVDRMTALADDIGYHPAGHPELRAAIAARYTRRGLPTRPEEVLVTSGAQQAIALVVQCHVAAGDAVLTESSSYPGALALFGAAAATVRTVPVGEEGLDVDALVHAMATRRPALTYLIPSCHNPTGTVVPPLHRRRIAAAAGEHDLLLIDDETVAELGFHGDPPPPLASYAGGEGVITVGSLSKLGWGGLRVGWIRAQRPAIARLSRVKALTDLGNDVVSQLAAAVLLRDPASLIRRRRSELTARHGHLTAELGRLLPDWTYVTASGGQTLWVRLPRGDAASFAQLALRHGVALLPGGALAPEGAPDRFRLPFLAPESTLTTAVQRLAAAWDAYVPERVRPGARPLNALAV